METETANDASVVPASCPIASGMMHWPYITNHACHQPRIYCIDILVEYQAPPLYYMYAMCQHYSISSAIRAWIHQIQVGAEHLLDKTSLSCRVLEAILCI